MRGQRPALATRSAGRTRTATRRTRSRPRSPALVCAADIARANGDAGQARRLRGHGRRLAGEGRELDRDDQRPLLAQAVLPARDQGRQPRRRAPRTRSATTSTAPVDQREIVDNSFLGPRAVRRQAVDDQTILNSLTVGDEHEREPLASTRRTGQFWHRFTFDGYGEQADGGDWDLFFDNPARPDARARVAAAGGRARRVRADRRPGRERAAADDRQRGQRRPDAARAGLGRPPPPDESDGKGTRSATPLAWTHAQFVRLAWSIQAGKPIERPSIVACRYQKELCPLGSRDPPGRERPGRDRRPRSPGTTRGRPARPRGPRSAGAGRRRRAARAASRRSAGRRRSAPRRRSCPASASASTWSSLAGRPARSVGEPLRR